MNLYARRCDVRSHRRVSFGYFQVDALAVSHHDGGVLVCIPGAPGPFHAPTTAAARAESWRRQVRDSQESKGKRMAYASVRPRAATVAGARGAVTRLEDAPSYDLRGGPL